MVKRQELLPEACVAPIGTPTDAVEPFESDGAVGHGFDVLSTGEVGFSAKVFNA